MNEKKFQDIKCLKASLKFIRWYFGFPEKHTELNPKKTFYLKVLFISVATLTTMIGSLLHLIKNVREGVYVYLSTDLNYIISMTSSYIILFTFVQKATTIAQVFLSLSDFETFGKPPEFDKTNKIFDKLSKIFYGYLKIYVMMLFFMSNVTRTSQCHMDNSENGTNEICGLFANTWFPFDIDFFPVKQLYLIFQIFTADYLYSLAGMVAWVVLETVHHVIVRIRHVKQLFVEALADQDPKRKRDKFNFAVRYHDAVLTMVIKLNDTFSIFMFSHMILSGVVLGSGIYALLHKNSGTASLVWIGWFCGVSMHCFTGQRLQNESILLGLTLYNNCKWYECSDDLKKDIKFVIMRCQKPMQLRAASFGIMGYPMFVAILKGSYSYIALLSQSD